MYVDGILDDQDVDAERLKQARSVIVTDIFALQSLETTGHRVGFKFMLGPFCKSQADRCTVLNAVSICITMQSMLASNKKKER
jgi:hypothetical protein